MAKKGRPPRARAKQREGKAREEPQKPSAGPGAGALAAAVSLAAVHALWALFQWTQLVVARSGGDSFCGIGDGSACAQIWDSPFASAIQSGTGLPLAGWGLVWSLVAFALPLAALVGRARGRAVDPVWAGAVLTALAGVASILVFAAASLALGQLCPTCALTYLLVIAYAALCLLAAGRLRSDALLRGGALAAGATLAGFLALLHPGLRTPQAVAEAGRASVEKAARAPAAAAGLPHAGASTGLSLAGMISGLPPRQRQALSDSLDLYEKSPEVALRPARSLLGPRLAPVRITEFTDVLCGHCADLHVTLEQLGELLPPGSFSLESRHFPLDSACNPQMPQESTAPVRCLAAKAQICLEGNPHAFDLAGDLFRNQEGLTEEKVFELASRFMARDRLEACVASDETETKLQEDIAWAMEHDLHGTPLVLVNGRRGSSFPPFLVAMVLSGGSSQHPDLAGLPPPRASAGAHAH